MAGRGFGKTRVGAEWVRSEIENGRRSRIALIARSSADVRDVMVEGESGILAICPPWFRPTYSPSKRRITWPNGATATTYTADTPDLLRGPQHDGAWGDEIATWRYAEEALSNLMFGLRLGDQPQAVFTTTPRPRNFIRQLISEPTTVTTRGSTYDNAANLPPSFLNQIISKYEGTTLGRQELLAELLSEIPGALWRRQQIDDLRVRQAPALDRIVVAIDPSASSGDTADEAGIIVAGKASDGHGYVLADLSVRASPHAWATAAIHAYHRHHADRIVAEVNQGGEMVELTLRTIDRAIPYKAVHASRGKRTRAEPVSALYEKGLVHHVGGFSKLEDEQCNYTGDPTEDSPNRMDALVWALTELMISAGGRPFSGEGWDHGGDDEDG